MKFSPQNPPRTFFVGKPENNTNLEISYASKKAIEVLEEHGGKIKLKKL